jgi:hypothetical protein
MPFISTQEPKDITEAALKGSDPIATEAVDMFMSIVGAEAGAMSLRCLAKGGRPRLLAHFSFLSFLRKGVLMHPWIVF